MELLLTEADVYNHSQSLFEVYDSKPTEAEMTGCICRFLRDFADESQFEEFTGKEE